MTDNQYELVKCYNGWGIQDNTLSDIDNPIIILSDKNDAVFLIQELNNRNDRIAKLVKLIQEQDKSNNELNSFKNNVLKLIEDKIQELEDQYKFGQEVYKGCPMHNIQFGINTLKELQKEIK